MVAITEIAALGRDSQGLSSQLLACLPMTAIVSHSGNI